jgi:hypothetical protein
MSKLPMPDAVVWLHARKSCIPQKRYYRLYCAAYRMLN